LDIAYGVATTAQTAAYARNVYDLTPHLGDIAMLSQLSNTLGLITAVPAVITGVIEFYALLKRQGLTKKKIRSFGELTETWNHLHPKVKVGLYHAWINYTHVTLAGYNWWSRKAAIKNIPTQTNVALSSVALVLILGAGYLGSQLVYLYGVGVTRESYARRAKEGKAE
jgi:uncharacterized membrane protein